MKRVFFCEVVTRDGFQMESNFVPTQNKIDLIDSLSESGYEKIEVTSFTSSKSIPMLRDAEEVMGRIRRNHKVKYTALVPNRRGAERAVEARVDELNLVMSTSETHNLANLRMPTSHSFAVLSEVIQAINFQTPINVSLSCCFGCPMEGVVDPTAVLQWASRFAELGVRGITICDTTGMADPSSVGRLIDGLQNRLLKINPDCNITLHFHNTRGMGLANLASAVRGGVIRFDSSLGGLGGCPYAPGASGNICSEDAIHMLQAMGYDTGIDIDKLMPIARDLSSLVGHDLPGQVHKSGLVSELHDAPDFVTTLRKEFA
jgi:hydroxymethylglutaryl-CoA lyase